MAVVVFHTHENKRFEHRNTPLLDGQIQTMLEFAINPTAEYSKYAPFFCLDRIFAVQVMKDLICSIDGTGKSLEF